METEKPPPKLLQHADRILPQAAHPHLIACCPTMDLVAVVNHEEQLNVYRFGGQRAFGLQKKNGEGKIVSLGWKFNGQYLAVGWSDGVVEVVSAETGNVLQHFSQPSISGKVKNGSDTKAVSCLGWGMNFVDVASIRKRTERNGSIGLASSNPFDFGAPETWNKNDGAASPDDFLERIPDGRKTDIPFDLPEQLARLDITSSMVKPPALPLLPPMAYKDGDHPAAELFSSQVSLDAAIANRSHSINALDVWLLAQDSGHVRLILYDALNIGEVSLPANWNLSKVNFRHCAFYAFSSTYMLLVDIPSHSGKTKTALVPLSLRFLHSSGSQLHVVESKTAQLQILVQYVGECLTALSYHWKHAKDLPAKFMDNINEELSEKNEPNLAQSLYHLAATGDCPPTLKEWLVDILAEQGHKRWDHSIMHGYTKVLEITHESLLPALDRCAAILSHLRGLAIYYEHSPILNVAPALFDSILNIIRCMRLLAHHVLLFCSQETEQFTTFSRWLRREIDVQAAQSPPNPNEEAEQDLGLDYALLFAYLQGPLQKSKLDLFVKWEHDISTVEASASMYEDLKRALESFNAGDSVSEELINLSAYFEEWVGRNSTLVGEITSHQRASSTITAGFLLEEGDVLVSDLWMAEATDGENELAESVGMHLITTTSAVVHKDAANRVNLVRLTHNEDFEGIRSVKKTVSAILELPLAWVIKDMKFVDDKDLMVLVADKVCHHLLSLPAMKELASVRLNSSHEIEQHMVPDGKALQCGRTLQEIDLTEPQKYIVHTFTSDDRLQPAKLEVNGRKNRRFVVVLGEDGRQMRILDLDYKEGDVKAAGTLSGGDKDGDDEMEDG